MARRDRFLNDRCQLTIWSFAIALTLSSVSSFAQTSPSKPLKELQREEQLQHALETLNQFDAQIQIIVKHREEDCIKAIGYAPFCDCVMKELPVVWDLSDYVAITTRSKDENGYAKLDKESQAAYDKVAPIRDRCVKQINEKR